jgi:esterase/lipase
MYILLGIIGVILLVVAAIYLWPLGNKNLQTGTPATVTYTDAKTRIAATQAREATAGVTDACKSIFLDHGQKTAKTVVMFHGVTACPGQFKELAQVFFDAGYNVYVPLAPHHGTPDKKAHGQVTSQKLVDYVNESVTTATGLGDDLGTAGLSGGGMLATWAAEYRPEVKRLLVMAPFYEPSPAQAPKWQLPLLHVLYGFHILPDNFIEPSTPDGAAFSYRALANYDIVTKNLKKSPTGLSLKSIAVVTSASDDQIDPELAVSIPKSIADANNLSLLETVIPADWNAGHAIVATDNPGVAKYKDRLFPLYFDYYEGKQHTL